MSASVINLKLFAPKYRQALLFAMIEGLVAGEEFCFLDDRDSIEIESELSAAGLKGYKWNRVSTNNDVESAYLIKRNLDQNEEVGCCGCCCAQSKA